MMNKSTILKLADDIAHYVGYPYFIFGTLANIMCIAVLIRPKMRATNIGFYLLALAINDICVLDISLMDKWLRNSHGIKLRSFNLFLCKLLPFLDKFFLQMSSWIVVAVSVERMAAVYHPIRYRNLGRCHQIAILLIILIVIVGVNSPIFYFYELSTSCRSSAPRTYIKAKYIIFYLLYWALPLLLLVISSSVIVCQLRPGRIKESTDEPTGKFLQNHMKKRSNKESIYLLLFINCMFIICISPFAIIGILITLLNSKKLNETTVQNIQAAYVIAHLFSYLNNVVNFVPYMMVSSNFRKELRALFQIKHSWKFIRENNNNNSYHILLYF